MRKKIGKSTKSESITDKMIGEADKICACSAVVGEIICAANERNKSTASLKGILRSIDAKNRGKK